MNSEMGRGLYIRSKFPVIQWYHAASYNGSSEVYYLTLDTLGVAAKSYDHSKMSLDHSITSGEDVLAVVASLLGNPTKPRARSTTNPCCRKSLATLVILSPSRLPHP